MSTIALLTDFGSRDWFTASMKGVILGMCPDSRMVDITHECAPGDIMSAAFILLQSCPHFPPATVFCVVVDPGVGSARAALACKAGGLFFVGPDNGVLSMAIERHGGARVHRIENTAYMRTPVSATFHGRDIFAPAAAHLARGAACSELGPAAADFIRLSLPPCVISPRGAETRVVYIDRFGNAFTSLTGNDLQQFDLSQCTVHIEGAGPIPLCTHYAGCAPGSACALLNAEGYLEIAVNGGSAANSLGLSTGSPVSLRIT